MQFYNWLRLFVGLLWSFDWILFNLVYFTIYIISCNTSNKRDKLFLIFFNYVRFSLHLNYFISSCSYLTSYVICSYIICSYIIASYIIFFLFLLLSSPSHCRSESSYNDIRKIFTFLSSIWQLSKSRRICTGQILDW